MAPDPTRYFGTPCHPEQSEVKAYELNSEALSIAKALDSAAALKAPIVRVCTPTGGRMTYAAVIAANSTFDTAQKKVAYTCNITFANHHEQFLFDTLSSDGMIKTAGSSIWMREFRPKRSRNQVCTFYATTNSIDENASFGGNISLLSTGCIFVNGTNDLPIDFRWHPQAFSIADAICPREFDSGCAVPELGFCRHRAT